MREHEAQNAQENVGLEEVEGGLGTVLGYKAQHGWLRRDNLKITSLKVEIERSDLKECQQRRTQAPREGGPWRH